MIPCYNSADYLHHTLNSVLQQDIAKDEMEIVVVDDCSTRDNPESVVKELGNGRVRFHRNNHNLGAIKTFNECITQSRGILVHILHSDDLVLPGFYKRYSQLFQKYPDATIFTGVSHLINAQGKVVGQSLRILNEDGICEDLVKLQQRDNQICTPSIVIPRKFYEENGGYNEILHHTADWEMVYRACVNGKTVFTSEPLSQYRQHEANDTQKQWLSGNAINEILMAGEYIYHLTPNRSKAQLSASRKSAARRFRQYFISALYHKNVKLAWEYAFSTLYIDPNPTHVFCWAWTAIKYPFKSFIRLWTKKRSA
jgi:glycosyltransferase involved in cell wall biosynthesis